MAKAAKAVPEGLHTVTPQLKLDNAAQTIDWYKKAFGAEEISRSPGPDGRIMHAEIKIGDSRFYLNDVMDGGKGPKAYEGSPVSFWLYVDNSDALFNRARRRRRKSTDAAGRPVLGRPRRAASPIPRATRGGSPHARKISRAASSNSAPPSSSSGWNKPR